MEDWQNDILDRVEKIKTLLDSKYIFTEKATQEEVTVFETQFMISLPPEFRWFVLNIANGITSKNEWGFDLLTKTNFRNHSFEEKEYNPAIPFPLSKRVLFTKDRKDSDNYPYETIYDSDESIFMNGYTNGLIQLAGYGCGTSANLVVNGKEFGNIWIEDYASNSHVFPDYYLSKNLQRLTFSQWLCKKVDIEAEQHLQLLEWKKMNPDKTEYTLKEPKNTFNFIFQLLKILVKKYL